MHFPLKSVHSVVSKALTTTTRAAVKAITKLTTVIDGKLILCSYSSDLKYNI